MPKKIRCSTIPGKASNKEKRNEGYKEDLCLPQNPSSCCMPAVVKRKSSRPSQVFRLQDRVCSYLL